MNQKNNPTKGVFFWSSFAFMLLMTAIQMIRALKDDLVIVAGLEHLPWLISFSFLLIVVMSCIIFRASNRFNTYAILSIMLTIVVICSYHYWENSLQSAILYIAFSALSLLILAQFWSALSTIFHIKLASHYYTFIIAYGTVGGLLGPLIVVLIVLYASKTALLIAIAVILLTALLSLHIATSHHRPQWTLSTNEPRPSSSNESVMTFVWFVLLYSLVATFLYYQQLEVVQDYFPDIKNRIALFGFRDLVIGLLTLTMHLIIHKYNLRIVKFFSLMPFLSIWLFLAIGILPTLIPVISAIIIFRTGNFTITKPSRELFYLIRPNLSKYKSIIDAAIYRSGDLLGVWLFAALKYLKADQIIITVTIVPLVVIWYLISRKVSLMVN